MDSMLSEWASDTIDIPASEYTGLSVNNKPGQIDEIVNILISSPIGNAIGYNELESAPYVRGVLPWIGKNEVRPWKDSDDSFLLAYLGSHHNIKYEKHVQHAFTIACEKTRFNPVIDAFDALPEWDGEKRAGFLLHRFLGAEASEYTQEVERLFFSGAIMRTYHPGTKFDYMPVLIGNQSLGKSTFARRLALYDEFFTDSLTGIGTKEGAELVQGNLIVEIGELEAIKGKARETTKAFISRMSDDYRAPYAKRTERHPRRFVLIGTTNSKHFLNDPSGNRRFLPIRCGIQDSELNIHDPEAIEAIRQAWAEMLYCYNQEGSLPTVLSDSVSADARQEQAEASEDDARLGMIESWLESREPQERVCISQICEEALGIDRSIQKQWQQTEVREILERNFPDWISQEKKKRIGGYGAQRAYEKS